MEALATDLLTSNPPCPVCEVDDPRRFACLDARDYWRCAACEATFPEPDALSRRYDFITCTEVAEHFHRPAREFARLDALLEPGG